MGLKLLGTATSPYVRIVRMQILQCGLDDRVDFEVVPTRVVETPLHAVNPSGKVPTLIIGEGLALSEARLVCGYLDGLHDGVPFVHPVDEPADRALEGLLVGCLDGMAVRLRELRRPEGERSPDILAQEERRTVRCLAWLDAHADRLRPAADYAMCCLAVTLGRLDRSLPAYDWRTPHPALAAWFGKVEQIPSFTATAPT